MSVARDRPAADDSALGVRQAADAGHRAGEPRAGRPDRRQARGRARRASTLKTFANGEVYCRYEESVRGADVFIVQPTCGNPDDGLSANDALMELLAMVDAAVGGSAHRVIAVTPWYGYSRQDKKSAPREPISARLVARMLESAGIDRILTMDLHSGPDPGLLPEAVRPHDGAVHAHPVLRRPRARGPRGRRPGRRPGEAEQEVRRQDRRRPGDPQQGAPRPAGRRDRLRDRRRGGQDRACSSTTSSTPPARSRPPPQAVRDAGARRVYAAATHGIFSGNAWENLAAARLRADRRHRHDPAARRARPTTSACSPAPTCSPTRSARSSPTAR